MSERVNARLQDEFGGSPIRVRGAAKVMGHLMFLILVLTGVQGPPRLGSPTWRDFRKTGRVFLVAQA